MQPDDSRPCVIGLRNERPPSSPVAQPASTAHVYGHVDPEVAVNIGRLR